MSTAAPIARLREITFRYPGGDAGDAHVERLDLTIERGDMFAVVGPNVYVGGNFTDAANDPKADRIARWDGSTWHTLGSGLNNAALAIAIAGQDVFVGGWFTGAGGDAARSSKCSSTAQTSRMS